MFDCRSCGVSKTLDAFPKRKDSPLGIRKECKDCFTEKNLVSARKYRKNTPSYYAAQKAYYERGGKHKQAARGRKRRAKQKGNGHSPYTLEQVFDAYGTDCYLCGEAIDLTAPRQTGQEGWEKGLHIEHYVDIALGGGDTLKNVRPAHGLCNLTKQPKGEDVNV